MNSRRLSSVQALDAPRVRPAFVCNNAASFARVRETADRVAAAIGHEVPLLSTHAVDPGRCIDLYEGFTGASPDALDSARRIREEFGLEPATLFTSDKDHHRNRIGTAEILARCLHVLRRARRAFDEHGVDHLAFRDLALIWTSR